MANEQGLTRTGRTARRRTSRARTTLLAALPVAAAALAMSAGKAQAQTPSPLPEWQYSSGIQLQKMFVPQGPNWQVEVGAGLQMAPLYDGAQRYKVQAGPSIDVRYDRFFLSTGEGLGVNLLQGTNYRAGVTVGYDLGRRAADYNSRLHGLGNINPAPEIKGFFEYAIAKSFPAVIRINVRHAIGGSEGTIGDAGIYMPLPGSSEKFIWFAGPTVTAADATYMNSYFGIGEAQANRSMYGRYKASAGIKSYGFGLTATWFLNPHWAVNANTAVSQLVGSAANSPITESSTEGVIAVAVIYKF